VQHSYVSNLLTL